MASAICIHLSAIGIWGPVLIATLIGAAISMLREVKRGGGVIDLLVTGLLAVLLGLFLAKTLGDTLQEFIPGLRGAGATAMAAAASTFGVGWALRILDRIDRS